MADDKLAELKRKAQEAESQLKQLDLDDFRRKALEAEFTLAQILEEPTEPAAASASTDDVVVEDVPAVSSIPGRKLSAKRRENDLQRLRAMRQLLQHGPSAAAVAFNPQEQAAGLPIQEPPGFGTASSSEAPEDIIAQAGSFVEHWGLDWRSLGLLQSLPPHVMQDVMRSFRPTAERWSMNAHFAALVKAKCNEHHFPMPGAQAWDGPQQQQQQDWNADGPTLENSVRYFTSSWGFQEKEVQMLMSIPQDVCWNVIGSFTPPPGTHDIVAALQLYVQNQMEQGGSAMSSAQEDAMKSFVAKWSLNEQSETLLRGLPPDQQSLVMVQFRPPEETTNTSGKFHAFVRSIGTQNSTGNAKGSGKAPWNNAWNAMGGGMTPWNNTGNAKGSGMTPWNNTGNAKGSGKATWNNWYDMLDPITNFVYRYSLEKDAERFLRKLPMRHRKRLMDEWDPKWEPATTNVSGSSKFAVYIRCKLNDWGVSEDGKDTGKRSKRDAWQNYQNTDSDFSSASDFKVKEFNETTQFVSFWMLDDQAEKLLQSLPQHTSKDLMSSFSPPSGTQNYTGSFMAYARRRLDAKGLGKQNRQFFSRQVASTAAKALWTPSASLSQTENAPGDEISQFVQKWYLDSSSEKHLRNLDEDLQFKVLCTFAPEPDTRNPNAKLATFIRRIASEPEAKRPRLIHSLNELE